MGGTEERTTPESKRAPRIFRGEKRHCSGSRARRTLPLRLAFRESPLMDLQAFATIISIPASVYFIISIPFSIYFFVQRRQDNRITNRLLEQAEETRKTYVNLVSSLSEQSDRVLLSFDKSNCEKPGTFEYVVWSYWEEYEELTRGMISAPRADAFIYNPLGVLATSELRIAAYRSDRFALVMIFLMGLSLAASVAITGAAGKIAGGNTFWHYVVAIPSFVIFVPLGVISYWRSFRRNRQNLRNAIEALEVIRQYVAVLENKGISLQQEFTQLKSEPTNREPSPGEEK